MRSAGVEVSETSCEWARKNARANGIGNAEFLTASAEAIFSVINFPAKESAVVIDPPPRHEALQIGREAVEVAGQGRGVARRCWSPASTPRSRRSSRPGRGPSTCDSC